MNSLRDLNAKIAGAEDFRYKEFIKSETATRLGIVNMPKEHAWQNIEKLAINVLQPIRNQFGPLRITSGFRTVQLCKTIGSSSTSNHVLGQAADIEPVNTKIRLFDILEWIHDNLEYRELIAEFFPEGWVHVAYRENANDRILKLKDSNHNFEKVNINDIRKYYGKK